MSYTNSKCEDEALIARVKGAVKLYEYKQEVSHIGFLDEAQEALVEKYFHDVGFFVYFFFSPMENSTRKFLTVGEYFLDDLPIVFLRAVPDKFHSPDHRDYMGALMALGIDRKNFGDLIVTDDSVAYLPVWEKGGVADYLFANFTSSGRAKLTLKTVSDKDFNKLEMKYETVGIIVSSLRADCVVASVTNFSRTQAKNFILNGDFKISSTPVCTPDRILSVGEVFSLKGFGKYRFEEIIGQTKRERIRIKLLKFGKYIER